ncbi:MAG: hypothetical protein IH884_13960 [Myxococcales bacterium]|nr:hypothetical protein [Myxococcales bacterium]
MSAAATALAVRKAAKLAGTQRHDVTLLELVSAVCDVTEDDREVVATVVHMLHSGEVRLCGNFRGTAVSDFD